MIYYSCVIDSSAVFYYQAWNLVNSLICKAKVEAKRIVVNCTLEVDDFVLEEIQRLGCQVRRFKRFGDGKYCNKIAQLDYEVFQAADSVVLLDADMLALRPFEEICQPGAISGKIVDFPNPDIKVLKRIYDMAGFSDHPRTCQVDCGSGITYETNLNGGLYAIPGFMIKELHNRWSAWAQFLLDRIHVLEAAGKQDHVDQVSFSMAAHELRLSINRLERIYNYPAHDSIPNREYPATLHYHKCMSPDGFIVSTGDNSAEYNAAIREANKIIKEARNQMIYESFLRHQPS